MVRRFDLGRLQKAKPIAGGAIAVPAYFTRVGVFSYRDANGKETRELRLPDEVFCADTLSSLRYAPVTDLHPKSLVNANNWREVAIGSVGSNIEKDGQFVSGEIVINEEKAINAIDSGSRQELSCGYECDLEQSPGNFEGEAYDCIQRNIRYNHVAIGPSNWGRAGSEVALRLDSGAAFTIVPEHQKGKEIMKRRWTIDGVDFEVDADEGFFQALKKNLDSAKATVDSLTVDRDKEKARADAADVKTKETEKRLDDSNGDVAITERVNLRLNAVKLLPTDYKFDGKDSRQIMIDVVKLSDEKFDAEKQSDDYVRARFDHVVNQKAAEKSDGTRKHLETKPNDDEGLVKAYDQFTKDASEAWKQPLNINRN